MYSNCIGAFHKSVSALPNCISALPNSVSTRSNLPKLIKTGGNIIVIAQKLPGTAGNCREMQRNAEKCRQMPELSGTGENSAITTSSKWVIGVAITHSLHSTKIAFQVWVTKVWSRKLIFKTGLQHFCKNIKIFFFDFEKDGRPK